MRILVTGANGYLGQGIVKQLLDLGHEVIATDIYSGGIDTRAVSKTCNLFSIENPYEYFHKPEVLLHLAWRNGFIHNANSHLEDLPKHCLFIKSMICGGVTRVGVMGSMHEVGFFEGCIDEDTICNPMNCYGIAKNALRQYTKIIAEENSVQWQWLRGYYIVSNSPYGSSIFSKIAAAVAEGKTEFPFTTGQNLYDFLDYSDFCFRVALAVSQGVMTHVINICSGKPIRLSERVEQFIVDNKYSIKLLYGAFPDRIYDSKAVWGNSKKVDQILLNYQIAQNT